MASRYEGFHQATIDRSYLHSNSTTHSFVFGALAELLDNSRDAGASRFSLFSVDQDDVQGGRMLYFLDNGCGMDKNEVVDVMSFGRSLKRTSDGHMIGMYGNGLKSGSMRIGRDMIMFTKKCETMTCILLSRTFLDAENLESIVVPVPAFDATTRQPISAGKKHDLEVGVITSYSPFKSVEQILEQFDRIETDTGTLIVCYNLRLIPSGETELDITSEDILARSESGELDCDYMCNVSYQERRSFSAYAAILYSNPKMKIYVQRRKVRTHRLCDGLYKQHVILATSKAFKRQAQHEAKTALDAAERAKVLWKDAQGIFSDVQRRTGDTTRQSLVDDRLRAAEISKRRVAYEDLDHIYQQKARSIKELKQLRVFYGLNIMDRRKDGFFIYTNERLVKMYEPAMLSHDEMHSYRGIVGIIDINHSILELTHNKQDFANASDFRQLKKLMTAGMKQYQVWLLGELPEGFDAMWQSFGYVPGNRTLAPSENAVCSQRRATALQQSVQCDKCLKWRYLPASTNVQVPEGSWECRDNPDTRYNSCQVKEQVKHIGEEFLVHQSRRNKDDCESSNSRTSLRISARKRSQESSLHASRKSKCRASSCLKETDDDVVIVAVHTQPRPKRSGTNDRTATTADLSVTSPPVVASPPVRRRVGLSRSETCQTTEEPDASASVPREDPASSLPSIDMIMQSTESTTLSRDPKELDSKIVSVLTQLIQYFAPKEYMERSFTVQELADFDVNKFTQSYFAAISQTIEDREKSLTKDVRKEVDLLKQAYVNLANFVSEEPDECWLSLDTKELISRVAAATAAKRN